MERDLNYENNNIGYDSQYPKEAGGGIKCKNYELCERVLPTWWFECKGHYLCINCAMMFGMLTFSDNVECPICLETGRGTTQPNCTHKICIQCFKRAHYGDDDIENQPIFPYPDKEEEYYDDQDNPKWDRDYPLIKKYSDDWKTWDDERQYKCEMESNLRACCICRK